MPPDDEPLFEALGARGADVVLRQDLEEGRARYARHHARRGDAQRQRREDDVAVKASAVARRRQPLQRYCKEQLQDQRKPELGDRQAQHAKGSDAAIHQRAAPHGGDHAQQHAHDHADHFRGQRQLDGLGIDIGDLRGDVAPAVIGTTEIAVQKVLDIVDVLYVDRLVQSIGFADTLHGRFVGVVAGNDARGVAGQHVDQQKHDDRQADQDGNHDQ